MQEERDKLKKVLNKKEPEFEDLENSQPIHNIKTEKVYLERTPRMWLDNHSIKRLPMDLNSQLHNEDYFIVQIKICI